MFGDTPLVMVESQDGLLAAVEALGEAPVIGVDIEADSFHHYQEKVCLVQISDLHNDYVIDPLSVPDLAPLGPLMANPRQVKIFHGADYDVVSLKRDFGFRFRNIFDTMLAAQFAGVPRFGLADLIRTWWGHEIDKRYQRHDWAQRPLEPEHLYYARGDTHFLPALRDVLLHRLVRNGWLEPLMEECRVMEEREWAGRTRQPDDYMRVKGSRELDETGRRVLRALYAYRDREGAAMDRPVFKVIPDPVLLDLAHSRPLDLAGLEARLRRGSPLARRHGRGLIEAITAGMADATPLPVAASREPREPRDGPRVEGLRGREQERLLVQLRDWRNAVMARDRLAGIAVVSNNALKEVARRAPRTIDELAAIPELRRWQVERWGARLVAVVQEAAPPLRVEGETAVDAADGTKKRRRRRRREGPDAPAGEAPGSEGDPVGAPDGGAEE